MNCWVFKYPFKRLVGKKFEQYCDTEIPECESLNPKRNDWAVYCCTKGSSRIVEVCYIDEIEWQGKRGDRTCILGGKEKALETPVTFSELRGYAQLRNADFLVNRTVKEVYRLNQQESKLVVQLILARNPHLKPPVGPKFKPPKIESAKPSYEGKRVWTKHKRIERWSGVAEAKREAVLSQKKSLACEICGFDFKQFYNIPLKEFCEVHHLKPLSELKRPKKPKLDELAVLCANCHRAIHLLPDVPDIRTFKKFNLRKVRRRKTN